MTERTRFTISVEHDVYEAFSDLAQSSGVSLSRCIGDWLRDTAEAAQMTVIKVNEVKRSHQSAFEAFMQSQALEVERLMEHGPKSSWGRVPVQSKLNHTSAKPVQAGGAGAASGARGVGPGSAAAPLPGRVGPGLVAPAPRPVIRGGKSPEQGKHVGGKRS